MCYIKEDLLEEKPVLKILGVMIQNDLKWESQIDYITKKASKTIWRLRRMKQLGVDETTLTDFWKSEGRVHLEANCPVWAGAITKRQCRALTRVQRKAVAAITQKDYHKACEDLKLEMLPERRSMISKKFAEKTVKKSRHQDIFELLPNPPTTRRGKKRWKVPISHTRRHQKSPVPYLTSLLNNS